MYLTFLATGHRISKVGKGGERHPQFPGGFYLAMSNHQVIPIKEVLIITDPSHLVTISLLKNKAIRGWQAIGR